MGHGVMFNVVSSIPRPSETTLHPHASPATVLPPSVQGTLPGIPLHVTCYYETPVCNLTLITHTPSATAPYTQMLQFTLDKAFSLYGSNYNTFSTVT